MKLLPKILFLLMPFLSPAQYFFLEAEEGVLSGVDTSTQLEGFSGSGYVIGLDSAGDFVHFNLNLTESAHYKFEIVYLSSSPDNHQTLIWIDGVPTREIRTQQTDTFLTLNAGTLRLDEGEHLLRIQFLSANLAIDYLTLTPVDQVPPLMLNADSMRIEAEQGILFGTQVEFGVPGYSAHGYVSNFDLPDEDKVRIILFVAEADQYELKIGYGVPFGYKENYLTVNGGERQIIAFEQRDGFGEISVGEIELEQGINLVEVSHFWGFFDLDYFEISRVVGLPPSAVSQGNVLLHNEGFDRGESVPLSASNSQDPDGTIERFEWILDDTVVGLGEQLSVELAVGTHFMDLRVTDNDGNKDSESFVVIINDLQNHKKNRIESVGANQQDVFINGINIAWSSGNNYARDLLNHNTSTWTGILDDISAAGGNAARWWLHTNGVQTPVFGGDGMVVGIQPEALANMKRVLDMAWERGIVVSMCLWSFDMLQDQGQNLAFTRAILEDSLATEAYIQHALIPMIEEIRDHPAVMTWEIFNEPEGMTEEFGWSDQRTTMNSIQRFVNRCAGAIHRTMPGAKVSNGIWNIQTATDSNGFFNFYRDDRLIAAGGDSLGTLDLVQVHHYGNIDPKSSPFYYPADRWGIEKPIIIGEFPANGVDVLSSEECYEYAYRLGYAGALSWSYTDRQFGGLPSAIPGIEHLFNNYSDDIIIEDSSLVYTVRISETEALFIYPNPVSAYLQINFQNFSQPLQIEIVDVWGHRIFFEQMQTPTFAIDVQDLLPGSYFIRILHRRQLVQQRFIKY